MNLRDYLVCQQQVVDAELDRLVPPETTPPETIHRAMRYSLFAGGKRIRPILCLEAARAVSEAPSGAEVAACALEFIHTYSLIHDDLPALDNDDYRRGKLTCHKVFGDAMAILAGDALLTRAFEVLSAMDSIPADRQVRMIAELATAAGTVGGMIGGQVADLEGEGQPPTAVAARIHTSRQDRCPVAGQPAIGAICAGADHAQYQALSCYGEHIGLAFQIVDDILDVEESSEALGKTAGKDAQQHKITFPAVYGIAESRHMAELECGRAHDALAPFGDRAGRLHELADLIVHRKS